MLASAMAVSVQKVAARSSMRVGSEVKNKETALMRIATSVKPVVYTTLSVITEINVLIPKQVEQTARALVSIPAQIRMALQVPAKPIAISRSAVSRSPSWPTAATTSRIEMV